jgi:hypothetical protein
MNFTKKMWHMYTYNNKMFRLKEWIHDYNHGMCGMMSYTISDKKIVTDNICVRLVPYSTHSYPYLYPRTSVFVFISEAIRIRIRIRIKIWKQIWFQWYPSIFDPITSLISGEDINVVGNKELSCAEKSRSTTWRKAKGW